MSKFIDMTGWKMWEHGVPDSHWTVLERAENEPGKHTKWRCQCDCLEKTEQVIDGCSLRNGTSKQCIKCGHKITGQYNSTHHETDTRLYRIWCGMKQRCNNPNHKRYKDYGGRGITICSEWDNSYEIFREWAMDNGYNDDLTIDRKDNDGNYEPQNCRFVDMKFQSNNRRNNRLITFNDTTHTLMEWSDILGLDRHIIESRMDKLGWSIERALTTPVQIKC